MKRSLDEDISPLDETLFLGNRDIWVDNIFPFLYGERFLFWMKLQSVSKMWFQMIKEGTRELILDIDYKNDDIEKCEIIGKERFCGERLVKLTAYSHGLIWCIGRWTVSFTNLKELVLLGGSIKGLTVDRLTNLTSLTLGYRTYTDSLEKLVNLTHLSMMYLSNWWSPSDPKFLSNFPHLKHLCIGRSKSLNDPAFAVLLDKYLPLPPNNKIEYLESNKPSPFKSYIGRGKMIYEDDCYYEGWIVKNQKHGWGTYTKKSKSCTGMWENSRLRRGTITWGSGNSYDGEMKSGRPNGRGIMRGVDGQVWLGNFKDGRII